MTAVRNVREYVRINIEFMKTVTESGMSEKKETTLHMSQRLVNRDILESKEKQIHVKKKKKKKEEERRTDPIF